MPDDDEHSRRLIAHLVDAIHRFQHGDSPIDELQGSFSIAADSLDDTSHDLVVMLRSLDADLERIQYAMARADQRAAVEKLIDRVLREPEVAAVVEQS